MTEEERREKNLLQSGVPIYGIDGLRLPEKEIKERLERIK